MIVRNFPKLWELPMRKLFVVLIALAGASLQSASANTPLAGEDIVTNHEGVFNGENVTYTATLSEAVIKNEAGEPTAVLSSTAYVRTGAADAAARPVVFIWNGGPSAASVTLHMAGLGPKRLVIPADPETPIAPPFTYEDSPHALLDLADLVFVDPVETGFSRLLKEDERSYFYSTTGDAASVTDYIRQWLTENGRTQSPVPCAGGAGLSPVRLNAAPARFIGFSLAFWAAVRRTR